MTAADYGRPAAFRIGRVFGDGFGVIGRNALVCSTLALVVVGIPSFLLEWFHFTQTVTDVTADGVSTTSRSDGFGSVVDFMTTALLQAALTRVAIEDLNGSKASLGDSLSTAAKSLLPVIGVSLLSMVGIFFGILLLVVPGIMLWMRWLVAIPVQVNEHTGPIRALSRSAELTAGSRWSLLGLFVIMIIMTILLYLVFWVAADFVEAVSGSVGPIIMLAASSCLASILFSIFTAVAYVELRFVKEGVEVKDLAEIFA